jgi:hypothetical protein
MEVEPVVSYKRLSSGDGDGAQAESGGEERVEPRFTVLPMERRARRAEIAPPTIEEAEVHGGARFEATPIDALPPAAAESRRRRFPVLATIGIVAVLVAFGILAATFGKIMTGGGNVAAVSPADTSTAVTLAPEPAQPEDTAGPGVRMIAPAATGNVPSTAPAATTGEAAATTSGQGATTQTAALPPASSAPADSPLPRLRPTVPTASSSPAPVMPAPAMTGAALPPPVANLPSPVAAGPAQQGGDDVNALMSDVDRILQQHRTVAPAPVAPPPMAAGTGAPMPVAGLGAPMTAADSGLPAMTGPAPLEVVAPPPPQPRRRSWFLFPHRDARGLPVPPADIPDPEGAPGQ